MTIITAAMPGPAFTEAQRRLLRRLAGAIIPASAVYRLPGADDEPIFGDMLRSLGRDARAVRDALQALAALASDAPETLPAEEFDALVQQFRRAHTMLANTLANVVSRCYYRDDRVMAAIGMELRPPFPQGFEVEEGDWSLLDPVRRLPPLWRAVD